MQESFVAVIVICAAYVVLKRYAPKALKRTARSWCAGTATRLGWHALAAGIAQQAPAGAACSDGCGACGTCGNYRDAMTVEKPVSLESLKRTIPR